MRTYPTWITMALVLAAALAWRYTHRPGVDMDAPAYNRPMPYDSKGAAASKPGVNSFLYARSHEHIQVRSRDVYGDLPPNLQRAFGLTTKKGRKNFHPTPIVEEMMEAMPPPPALPKVKGKPQLIPQLNPAEGEAVQASTSQPVKGD